MWKRSRALSGWSCFYSDAHIRDRNWLEFLAVLDATLPPASSSAVELKPDIQSKIDHAQELFARVSEGDGLKDRSGSLALLELEHRARAHGVSQGERCILFLPSFPNSSPSSNPHAGIDDKIL